MRRTLPSTLALAAFEAAARHQSYTRAADELSVTQSAICRQIGALEEFLGVRLFRRSRRGVMLTDAGASYSRQVAAQLDEVERATLDLMARGSEGGTLELGVVPTFATKWLLPRLVRFNQRHPGITVNLNARARPFLFDETPFDAAISAGTRVWPGSEGQVLMQETLVPLVSPAYFAAHRRRHGEEVDWSRCTLLQLSTRPYAWRQWFGQRGLQVDGDMTGPRMELFSMLIEAAIHGMGAALVPATLVEDELRRGLLVQASPYRHVGERSYRLMWPEPKAENRALVVFREWIDEEARAYCAAQEAAGAAEPKGPGRRNGRSRKTKGPLRSDPF